ncbi:MAG TPA: hypothetical protein PKG71_01480 [Candidatus Woesebacteria bacterium]|nr:hypothetical protein [Candidatus Woesebacteria bacterium]HNS94615.1 hypothetical protein [Candidatus Woesebacteria bacterium]
MIEQSLTSTDSEHSLDRKTRLMRRVVDIVTNRIAEGLHNNTLRISHADDLTVEKNANQSQIKRLSDLLRYRGNIIMCNHTAPDNFIQRHFSSLLPYGGSTPLDALMIIELINQTRLITESDPTPPSPLILQGANFGTSNEEKARTMQDIRKLELAFQEKVSIAPVLPGTNSFFNLQAIRSARDKLFSGGSVIVFPEKEYTQPEDLGNHTIQDGIGVIARLSSAPILPIYIQGSESYPGVLSLPGNKTKGVAMIVGTPVSPTPDQHVSKEDRINAYLAAQHEAWQQIIRMQRMFDPRFHSSI